MHNRLLSLSTERNAALHFRSAVSLHGHTRHSRENLAFIGHFLNRHRPLRFWIDSQQDYCRSTSGINLDWDRAYWTPPLCERLAHQLESRQIEDLGLHPIVSLTDHDTIEACTLLRAQPGFDDTPISTEWTIPWGPAVFHLGVHNLPPALSQGFMDAMLDATARADQSRVLDLLAELDRIPQVLLVFNHPLWNFVRIDPARFSFELTRFLAAAGSRLHAFELNGMRNHRENRGVLQLARRWNQLLLSGGDRHGCEPNGFLNLTNAADASEFIDEVRNGRQSTVLVMPQYDQPLAWRFWQNFAHVIADYPHHPETRRRWDQRTFHPDREGNIVPMSRLWRMGPPEFLGNIFAAALLAARLPVSRLLRRRAADSLTLPPSAPLPAFSDRRLEPSLDLRRTSSRDLAPDLAGDLTAKLAAD